MYNNSDSNKSQRVRRLIHLFGCLSVRFLIPLAVEDAPKWVLLPTAGVALLAGKSFLEHGATEDNGVTERGFFGGKVWWASIRPVHGVLMVGFAVMALVHSFFGEGTLSRWVVTAPLYVDWLVGVGALLIMSP